MAIEIPFDGIDADSIGGFDTVAPGWAHTEIVALDEESGDKGAMVVDFKILRHTASNQVDKVHRETFYKTLSSDFPRKKFMAFAFAAELTTPEEVKALQANGKSPSIEYTHAVGKQMVLQLAENDYNGRVSTQISFDKMFHPAAKKANDCPLDLAALAKAGIKLPEGRNPDGAVVAGKANGKSEKSPSTPNPSKQATDVNDVLNGM